MSEIFLFSPEHKALPKPRPETLIEECDGIAWDCDGVIADTEEKHWWRGAIKPTLATYGVNLDDSERAQFQGQGDLGGYIVETFGLVINPDIIYSEIKARLEETYRLNGIEPMPGAIELINYLHSIGMPQAVVSSSPTAHVEQIMTKFSIRPCFGTIIGFDKVESGRKKPHPDPYWQAADRLGIERNRCLVIEDAETGIEAARRGNMRSLAVPNPFRETGFFAQADLLIPSLETINFALIGRK